MERIGAEPSESRYERKFVTAAVSHHEVLHLVKLHPLQFSEIYRPRSVNNIYLDTAYRRAFSESVEGVSRRRKLRVRWYGELFGPVPSPVLEVKAKQGLVGGKERYPLTPFVLDRDFNGETLSRVLRDSRLPEATRLAIAGHGCSLLNRYQRRYFLSADRRYRITLDTDLEAYELRPRSNSFLNHVCDRSATVLELKYSIEDDADASRITNVFPFRMTKLSKYVLGTRRVAGGVGVRLDA